MADLAPAVGPGLPESLSAPWLVGASVVGLVGALLARRAPSVEAERRRALVTAALLTLLTSAAGVEAARAGAPRGDPLVAWLGAPGLLVVDELTSALLPLVAMLWLAVLLALPRVRARRGEASGLVLAEALTVAVFSTASPLLLAAAWAASAALLLVDLARRGATRAFRVAAVYLVPSSLAFVVGASLLAFGSPATLDAAVLALVVAVLVRKGIVPFHGWMPEVFESGYFGSAILFGMPQVGSYAAVRLLLPVASYDVLSAIGLLALVTAVYGAAQSVAQRDTRRAFAFLFMSQSALVLAGIDSTSVAGLTGAMVVWISSGVALTGLGLTVWVLEARRGRLDLDRLHGGHDGMPRLAAMFLVLGLTAVGFPGTLGFVGEELLVDAAIERYPAFGFAVVVATALNGISVLRMYLSLFAGPTDPSLVAPLRWRERGVFFALVGLLLVGGLAPRPLLVSRERASEALLRERAARGLEPLRVAGAAPDGEHAAGAP